MTIIVSKAGKNAQKIQQSNFDREDHLQRYIYENPSSIPLYDIKEDIQLLILIREYPTNSGPIDALGVDAEGNIYLVETKLYKNADKRTVVAQVLDYGASLWKNGNNLPEFIAEIDRASQRFFGMPVDTKLREFFGFEEEDVSIFWNNVKDNLNEGNFKFVVLMDQLHQRLKDLIVFLNQNSQFDVYAVELEYYKHDSFEIIIPRLFGAEVKKDIAVKGTNTPRKNWDIHGLMDDAKKRLSKAEFECFTKLYEFLRNNAEELDIGTGAKVASLKPRFSTVCPRAFFTASSDGKAVFYFNYLNDEAQKKKLYEALKLQKVSSVDRVDPNNFSDLYLKTDEVVANCDQIIKALQGFIKG
ncbi:hypothetical protein IPG41_05385 [Candidatus Peregrinibacteria bacterium]|nr:MAG: hypothetical protein IPG41_05385 [Candidatus Peregrinibacteria bacterium]